MRNNDVSLRLLTTGGMVVFCLQLMKSIPWKIKPTSYRSHPISREATMRNQASVNQGTLSFLALLALAIFHGDDVIVRRNHDKTSIFFSSAWTFASSSQSSSPSSWMLPPSDTRLKFTESLLLKSSNHILNNGLSRTSGSFRTSIRRVLRVRGGSADGTSCDGDNKDTNNQNCGSEVISTANDYDDSVEIDLADDDDTRTEEDGLGSEASDIKTGINSYENDDKDEMELLRNKWATIPAVPSIEYPPDVQSIHRERDAPTGTLGDFDESQPTPTNNPQYNTDSKSTTKAIILMDAFSPYHGQYIAHAARHLYGAAVIHVLSDFFSRYLFQVEGQMEHLSSRLPDLSGLNFGLRDNSYGGESSNDEAKGELQTWKSSLPSDIQICGIYCESDSGLEDAERFGVALGLYPRYHDGFNKARRDKFLMNEVVKSVGGLEVVQQQSCKNLNEALEFARDLGVVEDEEEVEKQENLGPQKREDDSATQRKMVVVKPLRGVASDDVHLCSNLASVRMAFNKVHQSPVFGSPTASKHERVLLQEFASGVEYAVDVVCKDGERKVAALWRYDKRAANGAPFVYFGTELVSAAEKESEVERAVCEYVFEALDALGVRWGISHVEVIADEIDGRIRVRLVEVNW